jgi:hypothetical protein
VLGGTGVAALEAAAFPPAPPLMQWPAVLTYGTCGVITGLIYLTSARDGEPVDRRWLRTALVWLGVATTTLIVYGTLLTLCTVVDPQTERVRFQIGFGLAGWSLTSEAQRLKEHAPSMTATQLMMAFGGFTPGGAARIWTAWSIYSAGILLIVLYLSSFISWTIAAGLVAARLLRAGVRVPLKGRST